MLYVIILSMKTLNRRLVPVIIAVILALGLVLAQGCITITAPGLTVGYFDDNRRTVNPGGQAQTVFR